MLAVRPPITLAEASGTRIREILAADDDPLTKARRLVEVGYLEEAIPGLFEIVIRPTQGIL